MEKMSCVDDEVSYSRHIQINPMLVSKLQERLDTNRVNLQPVVDKSFRNLNKKQQNVLIMQMLTKINNQILKFNVKKLFQIWAIYHPEDINCQIISQLMFKGSSSSTTTPTTTNTTTATITAAAAATTNNTHHYIDKIRLELLQKNRKIRKNNAAKRMLQRSPAGYNAALIGGEYCCMNNAYATMSVIEANGRTAGNRKYTAATTATTTTNNATSRTPTKRQRQDAFKIPAAVEYQLFRALDKRGVLSCAHLFDVSTYHVTDLPLLMCYTDYHIQKLIDICRKARTFPIHLLPVYLRRDVELLLRL